MNQINTGNIIRATRLRQNITQRELAERIGVSNKAVSKWERGYGAPDLSLVPALAEALGLDTKALLNGDLGERKAGSGNMKKLKFYVCPCCENLIFSAENAGISCCGKRLAPLSPKSPSAEEALRVEHDENELYITSEHEMTREHHISFVALLSGDTLVLKKLYSEWNLEMRLPFFAHGKLLRYCNEHGLFIQDV